MWCIMKEDYFAKTEIISKEKCNMIVMDVRIDNFVSFKDFHMNMSYPKKIVGSCIQNEYLGGRENFRYKKVNIIMGANASGKTSLGKMLMRIFNFIDKKQYEKLTEFINDTAKEASFTMDFVTNQFIMYRIRTVIKPRQGDKYQSTDIAVKVKAAEINSRDSYETCVSKIEQQKEEKPVNYIEELEKVQGLSWMFEYPFDSAEDRTGVHVARNREHFVQVLEKILKTLDPAINKVEKSDEIENTYIVRYVNKAVIIQDGKILDTSVLSSGTKAGIEIAGMLTAILDGECGFYYCDEKFSYIHSDVEKAILSVMIQKMGVNEQLFFTTHNTEILDMPLPKHSFLFLKKDVSDEDRPIQCISASSLLKRNTDNLKNAVENELFSVAPDIGKIYQLADD